MSDASATPSLILMRRRITLWFWAMLVGALAAAVTLGFRATMHGVEWLLTRHSGELISVAHALEPWQRLVVCTLGAAAAGLTPGTQGTQNGVYPAHLNVYAGE